MFEYLSDKYKRSIKSKNLGQICEIRMRLGKHPKIITNNGVFYLENIKTTYEELENVVNVACNGSIYSYDEQLRRGFITTQFGERIGLAGEFVLNNGEVIAIKNYTSLNIRIPSEVNGFSYEFFKNKYKGGSVLVISKTGVGKTTFIRDFTRNISSNDNENVVVIDERNEIGGFNLRQTSFDLGKNTDVLSYSDKFFGFNQAIRTLNPSVIVTDELITSDDASGVLRAILSGISVIATVHSKNFKDLFSLLFMSPLIENRLFDYYVFIDKINNERRLKYYNKDFLEI